VKRLNTTNKVDKIFEAKKTVKKIKLNEEPSNTDLYKFVIDLIDNRNIDEIKKLSKNIFKDYKNDLILELYCNNLLTFERLQFIMKYFTSDSNISSNLIKRLIKDENVNLLDTIFTYLKFYDNDLILQLLFFYKYKTAISTSELKQQISNEKFEISINIIYSFSYNNLFKFVSYDGIGNYLLNECNKEFAVI